MLLKMYIPRPLVIVLSIYRNCIPLSVWPSILKNSNKKRATPFKGCTYFLTALHITASIMTNCAIPAHFRCYEICEMRAAERGRELWVGRVSYQITTAIFLINLKAVICGRAPLGLSPSDKTSKNSFPFPQSVSLINLCINNWSSPVCFQRSAECSSLSGRGGTFCVNHIRVPF